MGKIALSTELIRISVTDQAVIHFDASPDGMFSLTEIHKRFGDTKPHKQPAKWLENDHTKAFLRIISNSPNSENYRSTPGRYGSTWATQQIALAYLAWLSPESQVAINNIVIERMEEMADPELALQRGQERAREGYRRKGKSEEWIDRRIAGKKKRNHLTSELAGRINDKRYYAFCTNAIYRPVIGCNAADKRTALALKKSDDLRDNLTGIDLAGVEFAETLSVNKLQRDDVTGDRNCERTCAEAGRITQKAIADFMNGGAA